MDVGDNFWLYINPVSKAIDSYRFRLENGHEGHFKWEGYRQFGHLKLATRRRSLDGRNYIKFENIRVGKFDLQ